MTKTISANTNINTPEPVTGTVHIDPLSIKSYTANLPATHLISSSMEPASSHQRYELGFLVNIVENSVGGSFCSTVPFL